MKEILKSVAILGGFASLPICRTDIKYFKIELSWGLKKVFCGRSKHSQSLSSLWTPCMVHFCFNFHKKKYTRQYIQAYSIGPLQKAVTTLMLMNDDRDTLQSAVTSCRASCFMTVGTTFLSSTTWKKPKKVVRLTYNRYSNRWSKWPARYVHPNPVIQYPAIKYFPDIKYTPDIPSVFVLLLFNNMS